ncbi:MAG TPA: M56 and DUF3738 domain-containing protein [Terriglobia bacterium]|nr:M56 and DUF3738 domain-containing protein [Terriglobia bacterium]
MSSIWVYIAPELGNHLWQSTLCLVIVGLLTLMLRRNHAQARYVLWLAVSVKFLIPFSLLIAIGSQLAGPRVVTVQPELYSKVQAEIATVGDFLTVGLAPIVKPDASPEPAGSGFRIIHLLPAFLVATWFCGFLAVLFVWCARWRRISAVVRDAEPLKEGREVEALRCLERQAGIRKHIELLMSRDSLEPGIFGIARPILLWPKGISEHLQNAHLDAILAHEIWHVRRRDNLAAALHMVVEAIFWFHPLVWWLGGRLLDERERACDEEVLRFGSEPKVYAESILKACEFCMGPRLACVSGVTGADLKGRIVRIMNHRLANKLGFARKLMLVGIGIAAVAGPIIFGLLNSPQTRAQSAQATSAPLPSFEVASIKPNRTDDMRLGIMIRPGRFTADGANAKFLITFAYNVKDFQISGGPKWIDTDRYNVDAKEEDSLVEELQKLPPDQRGDQIRLRVQSLLADRFKLSLSHATKELPVYALVIAKNGPKLHEAKAGETYPNGIKGPDGRVHNGMGLMRIGGGELTGQGVPMSSLVHMLSQQLGRDVLDKSGLKGNYDFNLKWTPDPGQGGMFSGPEHGGPGAGSSGPDSAPPPDASGPSIFTAVQEQLGLKLESQKGPVDILVIEHIEKPSED